MSISAFLEGFQPLFYLIAPGQRYIPSPTFQLYFFIALEAAILLYLGKKDFLLSCFMVHMGTVLADDAFNLLFSFPKIYHSVYLKYRIIDLGASEYLHFFIAMVFVDFLYYWLHRVAHEVHVFWKLVHAPHHAPEDYTLPSTIYNSAILVLYEPFFYINLALLGVPVETAILHITVHGISQFWLHTTVLPRFHWTFEIFFNSPTHHRVHHSRNVVYHDKNYGGIFIIFDRIFGTFQDEIEGEPPVPGLDIPVDSFNPINVHFGNAYDLFKNFISTPGVYEKARLLIKGPRPDPADKGKHLRPTSTEKYEPHTSVLTKLYITVQLAFVVGLCFDYCTLPNLPKIANMGYQFVSLCTLGAIIDGKRRYVFLYEAFRVAVIPYLVTGSGWEFAAYVYTLLSLTLLVYAHKRRS